MINEQRHYLSYLLRLWQERATLPTTWRASLENPQTGERLGFADVAQLFAFLEAQLAGGAVPGMPHPLSGGPADHASEPFPFAGPGAPEGTP